MFTAAALAAGLLQAGTGPVAAAPGQPVSGEAKALATARDTGQPVAIPERTTETSQTFANPDGSLTAELAAEPVRARHGDGSWGAIDFTLRKTADGTPQPVAAPYSAALSGGGSGPLVKLAQSAKSLALTWPHGALPEPVISGNSATYPNVLPDVDLRASLDQRGFSEVLVVKNRQAAANPALTKVRLGIATTGVTVRGDGSSFSAVDSGGTEVFGSGTPMMWDSGSQPTPGKAPTEPVRHEAAMPLAADSTSLEITPSQSLLTAADTVYPVYIDPSVSVGGGWSMINHRFPNQSYLAYDRNEGAKVGHVEDPQDGWERYRSMFRFPTAQFAHKHVTGAMFSITIIHSWSCTSTNNENQLYHIDNFDADTTWNNHSGSWDQSLTTQVSESCNNAHKRVEFSGGQLLNKAQGYANSSTVMPLGLKATNESTINTYWKKFDGPSARLNITYNTIPDTPTGLDVAGKQCKSGESRAFVGETTPTLSASFKDPDAGQLLSVGIYYGDLGSTEFIGSITATNIPAVGGNVSGPIPAGKLADGRSYYFHARGYDGIDVGTWSPLCEFTVDATRPNKTPTVSSADYPDDGGYHGGVGRTGRFTFSSNGVSDHGTNDILGYYYSFSGCEPRNSTPVLAPALGGDVSIGITPTNGGQTTLCVRSFDRAWNVSDPMVYVFNTGRPTDPVANYPANDGAGQSVADSSGNGHPASLSGGATWVAGHTVDDADKALHFDGSTGSASTAGPVVSSDKTFTVSAWVRVTAVPAATATVVSGTGTRGSGFALQYRADGKQWAFTISGSDADAPAIAVADSGVGPVVGTWVHLAGVYDAVKNQASLYVNGKLERQPVAVPASWNATGPLLLGRAQLAGAAAEFFAGDVDDVQVWDRVVVNYELLAIVNGNKRRGQWNFDECSGTTSADNSGNGHDVTLTSGASWIPDAEHFACAALFNGTNGYAQTTGPVVRTDQSFSVAAWVRLDANTTWTTFVSQDGNRNSNFYLQYRTDSKKWAFSLRASDTDNAAVITAAAGVTPTLGLWTPLVGVYDAVAKEIRIYVGGTISGSAKVASNWHAAGPLAIGRGKNGGGLGDMVRGAVDSVQVYSGVMSGRQIADFSVSPNA